MPGRTTRALVTLLSAGAQHKDVVTHAPCRPADPVASIAQTQECDSQPHPVSPVAETPSRCAVAQPGRVRVCHCGSLDD